MVPELGSHLAHIFLLLVENIERIPIIEGLQIWAYLMKSMGNPGMSIGCDFSSDRVQVPPWKKTRVVSTLSATS